MRRVLRSDHRRRSHEEADVTTPDERLPEAGTGEAGSEHDPERAEAYAESVGVDPSPQEVDTYLEILGDEPLGDGSEPT
jgi:hypothetical protein